LCLELWHSGKEGKPKQRKTDRNRRDPWENWIFRWKVAMKRITLTRKREDIIQNSSIQATGYYTEDGGGDTNAMRDTRRVDRIQSQAAEPH
jgi:hypothetical protein